MPGSGQDVGKNVGRMRTACWQECEQCAGKTVGRLQARMRAGCMQEAGKNVALVECDQGVGKNVTACGQ